MGLSFLVGEGVETLDLLVRWGGYRRVEAEDDDPDHRDAAAQDGEDGETEAGRDRRQTTGESGGSTGGEATGGETRSGEARGGAAGGEGTQGKAPGEDESAAGSDETGRSRIRSWWQRTPRAEAVRVTLPAPTGDPRHHPIPNSNEPGRRPAQSASSRGRPRPGAPPGGPHRFTVPDSGGLVLHAVARPLDTASFAGRTAPGTRSVSVFLANERVASRRTVSPDRGGGLSRCRPRVRRARCRLPAWRL